jgi:hypothetical protein
MFAVMKHLDIMIGIDFHICWPPWLPEPLTYPHAVLRDHADVRDDADRPDGARPTLTLSA